MGLRPLLQINTTTILYIIHIYAYIYSYIFICNYMHIYYTHICIHYMVSLYDVGVGDNSIKCVACHKWVHKRCSGISGRLGYVADFRCRRCLDGDSAQVRSS